MKRKVLNYWYFRLSTIGKILEYQLKWYSIVVKRLGVTISKEWNSRESDLIVKMWDFRNDRGNNWNRRGGLENLIWHRIVFLKGTCLEKQRWE